MPTNATDFKSAMADRPFWVVHRNKQPFYASGKPRSGTQGSPQDLAQLVTLAEVPQEGYSGPGFAFTPEHDVTGLDFDHCVSGGVVDPRVMEVIKDTHWEISPSGTGVHGYFIGKYPNRKDLKTEPRCEVFSTSGYMTYTRTGNGDLAPLPVAWLDERFGVAAIGGDLVSVMPRFGYSVAQVRDTLGKVPNDDEDHDTHLKVIAAVHHELGAEDGEAPAREWAMKSAKFNAGTFRAKWRSFGKNPNIRPTTFATVLGMVVELDEAGEILPPELSEDHLALEFFDRYAATLRVMPGQGWMVNAEHAWQRDDSLIHFDAARRVVRAATARTKSPQEKRRLTSAKTAAAVLKFAQADQRIVVPATRWDADPMALNTPGGIVDLKTSETRPRRPDDYVTQVTPVAADFSASAPVFLRFISEIFGGDAAMVAFMQRALGYCLSGSTLEQVLFFWYGRGANGKSTLLDLIHWLLGSYALKVSASVFMVQRNERHPTEIAQLRGKRAAFSSELDEGQFWNEALIKELTGDAVMSARLMRQDPIEFRVQQKHIIVGNHKPRLRSADHAIARRLVLVPFEMTFKGDQRDNQLPDKLRAEAPAILAWMVRGAVEWHRKGLDVPDAVRAVSAEYVTEHDDLALWAEENCERIGEATGARLYQDFSLWKRLRGENAQSMTAWNQKLEALPGVRRRKSNGRSTYSGIQLRSDPHTLMAEFW
jgi:putative DNA primase/helicase